MTLTADTRLLIRNPSFEDYFFSKRVFESFNIDFNAIVDSSKEIIKAPSREYKKEVDAFFALSLASMEPFIKDGEDYSGW